MFRVSIQDSKVRAFDGNENLGEATMAEIEKYCKDNEISMPIVWNEQDTKTIEIIKNYFGEN